MPGCANPENRNTIGLPVKRLSLHVMLQHMPGVYKHAGTPVSAGYIM